MPSARVVNPRALLAHRNVLVAFTRFLMQGRSGGLMGAAIEMLVQVLPLKGALGYKAEARELVLVNEHRLPRRAKGWLAHLPTDQPPWFIAQHVAAGLKAMVDEQLAEARMGHSIRPVLTEAGWGALAAAPVAVGRDLKGVLVLAGAGVEAFDRDTMMLLETVAGILALGIDRDDALQREREEKLRDTKTGQLATVGLLASTAACDLAAPLGSMQLQVEDQEVLIAELRARLIALLGEEATSAIEELDELQDLNEVLSAGLRNAQGVTSRLLAFARESKRQTVDFTHVVDTAVAMVRPSIEAKGIRLGVGGDDRELLVEGRQESLQMLVVQLLLYAVQECEAAPAKYPCIELGLETDDVRHQLTLETSSGSERSNAQLFDNYVAKSKGAQAMMGLALAKQTVLAHNGHIEHGQSSLGGILVRVVLPGSKRAVPRERRFDSRPPPPPGGAAPGPMPVVLWVDSDDLTEKSLKRCLDTHQVFGAQSLAEARELLAKLHHPPVMVFCDVNLPDGRGVELHQEVDQALRQRFVFITGGVIPTDAAQYLVRSGRPTLIKPISIEEVVDLLAHHQHTSEHPARAPTLSERPPPMPASPVPPPPALPDLGEPGSAPYSPRRPSERKVSRRQATTVEASPAAKLQKGR